MSWHFNNCTVIIGWPIYRLKRYFLDRKRNFLPHFARKSQHHHSIIPIIGDKHTHTQDLCAVTLITQGLGKHVDYRHCVICISHLKRWYLCLLLFRIEQNFLIFPHLLGPSPFEVIMVIFTISQHIPHLKRIIWNDHLNTKFEQWTSFGKNVEVEVFKNKTPGSWVHWPFIYCALQCPGRGIFSSRKEMSFSMKCMIYTWYIAGSKIKIPPFYRAEGGDGWQSK